MVIFRSRQPDIDRKLRPPTSDERLLMHNLNSTYADHHLGLAL